MPDPLHAYPGQISPDNAARYARLCRVMTGVAAGFFMLATAVLIVTLMTVSFGTRLKPDQIDQIAVALWVHLGFAAIAGSARLKIGRAVCVSERSARWVLSGCVMAGLLSLDRFVGIVYPPPPRYQGICQPHPVRGWAHRPGVKGLFSTYPDRVNALGMRGPEIPSSKPTGQTRILVVGDSIVVGFLMPRGDTPVDHLNDIARKRHPNADLLFMNGGCAGYTTWQEFDFIRNEGMKTRPDLLILVFCFNDMAELVGHPEGAVYGMADVNPVPKINYPSGLVRAATTIFDDWRMARIRDAHLWVRTNPFADPDSGLRRKEDLYVQPPKPAVARAWARACRDLDAVNEFCRERKLPWVLVAFPTRQLLDGEVDPNGFAPLKDWATRAGVTYCDLAPDFARALNGRPGETLMMDDLHPNRDGSLLSAERLLEFLSTRGLLGPRIASSSPNG